MSNANNGRAQFGMHILPSRPTDLAQLTKLLEPTYRAHAAPSIVWPVDAINLILWS